MLLLLLGSRGTTVEPRVEDGKLYLSMKPDLILTLIKHLLGPSTSNVLNLSKKLISSNLVLLTQLRLSPPVPRNPPVLMIFGVVSVIYVAIIVPIAVLFLGVAPNAAFAISYPRDRM